ncbi:unnamed protein product [Blepharisma stoltei]|uniref:C2H2-type domain-containing protein n=1 Tax=Blepharisma stoltei TaxID=1481888 RepID=A0AAU9JBC4_9CILI|nr:unnamed protein product [Blepharisma stoltei]
MERQPENRVSASTRYRQKNQGVDQNFNDSRGFSNYQCNMCRKILSSKQNLKEHMFIHTGQKPYVCKEPGCGLTFRQGSQLSAHKRIHTAIRTLSNTSEETAYLKLTSLVITGEFILEKCNYPSPDFNVMDKPLIALPPISGPQPYNLK